MKPTYHVISAIALLATVGQCQSELSDGYCDYQHMAQAIDHFGDNDGTFQQRYSVYAGCFKPGGPILFFQGEEGVMDCANSTILYNFAKELGGMAVSLEHRYFGESMPFGTTNASWTNHGMRYLTLENVMADAVAFIDMLKATFPGAKESKVAVASGSYGGYIVTAFRQNHPRTFHAALAAAAPVDSFGNSSHPTSHHWYDYISRTYRERSYVASQRIKAAFDELVLQISHNSSTIADELNLCTNPSANDTAGINSLMIALTIPYVLAVEFNYAKGRPGRGGSMARPFDTFIEATLASDPARPLSAIRAAMDVYYGAFGDEKPKCIDWRNLLALNKYFSPGIERTPFNYIGCRYSPQKANDIAPGGLFPPRISSDSFAASCEKNYNITPPTQEELWTRFHISPAELANSTQIIFSTGEFDPVTAVAPQYMTVSNNPCASRVLYASRMAHREDLFLPDESDEQSVVDIRNAELQLLRGWFAEC